ncbi:MAG: hypothetical protein ACQ9MH_11120 [Nitrospinales bacterium]
MKKLMLIIVALGLIMGLHGCAFYQAAIEPGVKDVSIFEPGTSRNNVIAEFGSPIHSNLNKPGSYKSELYQFVQGDGIATKSLKATGRTVLDLMTIALVAYTGQIGGLAMLSQNNNWYSRDITVYKVIFDADDKVILAQKININSQEDIYPLISKSTR